MAESILLALAEEERLRNKLAIERRLLREASRPLMLPDKEFTAHFRLRKSQFEDLCADLIPFLPHPKRSTSVSLELKVLAALAFYANGCYQKNVGAFHLLGLSQSIVSKCINEVTEAINQRQIILKYIRFPLSRMEREAVAARFMEKFEIPGVIGCIDGTHVAIVRPNQDEEVYFNRKHYHSLNVLIICDADLRILHVDASFGGQSHDSHIWNSSCIKGIMQDLHEEGEVWWLLGDSGYAQRPWLMIPILNAAPNSPEEFYTKKHVHTRNVVERCIGVLKNRWRCLLAHRFALKLMQYLVQTLPLHLTHYAVRLLGIKTKLSLLSVSRRLVAMNEVLHYFSIREWRFKTDNVQKLQARLTPQDAAIYNLDPHSINWDEHCENFVKGTRKYLLKEKDQDIDKAKRHLRKMKFIHNGVLFFVFMLLCSVLLKQSSVDGLSRFLLRSFYYNL